MKGKAEGREMNNGSYWCLKQSSGELLSTRYLRSAWKIPDVTEIYNSHPVLLNHLKPELSPSAQRCLSTFFTGILIFKWLTATSL
jgi:hypothetical protein